MSIENLNCVSENVNLDDYYKLYDYVRENMEYPQWLGYIPKEETINILNNGGKIWLYYDNSNLVCSMFYIPSNTKSLVKHNIFTKEEETGSLGPIMVSPDYVGKGYMKSMLKIFNEYNRNINNKYIFTKVVKDNIYSVRNIEKDGYEICDVYENERGINNAYLKKL